MARIRTIKPEFFMNEDVADLPFEARLLFIGLWTLADRRGRLEDRPKRIKASIFPYDDMNVDYLLQRLHAKKLIIRYIVPGHDGDDPGTCLELSLIQIVNFEKHQVINTKEKETDSKFPSLREGTCRGHDGDIPGTIQEFQEGKGKEGKGKERNKNKVSDESLPVIVSSTDQVPIPIFIDPEIFASFKQMRKKIKKPLTDDGERMLIAKLTDFNSRGINVNECLSNSIINSWQGVFEPKEDRNVSKEQAKIARTFQAAREFAGEA